LAWKRKILLKLLFELIINNLNGIKTQLWDTQKNIEEDVKSVQKREEPEEEIKKDSLVC
tara:strand:- start:2093 stop:2269 length:177 start_codon:yes stop_codon:yes gene_type:complete